MKRKVLFYLSLGLLLIVFIINNYADAELKEQDSNWTISKTSIYSSNEESFAEDNYVISPDKKRIAYAVKETKEDSLIKSYIVLDGNKQNDYLRVVRSTFAFSPNSQHFAYLALTKTEKVEDRKLLVIIDGNEEQIYPHYYVENDQRNVYYNVKPNFTFSPDSKHFVYSVINAKEKRWFVVLDGKERKEYEGLGPAEISFTFSPDSRHLAYAACDNYKWFVVLDGKEDKLHDSIFCLTFSPDSQHFAYAAIEGSKSFMVIDEKEQKSYDGIVDIPLTFSPDSQHFAYGAREGDKRFVVLDGKEQKKYDEIVDIPLTFSPDSQHFAYAAIEGNKYFVVLDGKEGKQYDAIADSAPVFSPDSQRLAYVAKEGEKWHTILDGEEQPFLSFHFSKPITGEPLLFKPIFSPDSQRFAYTARENNKSFIVMDGEKGKEYDLVTLLTFSPDSQHHVYLGGRYEKHIIRDLALPSGKFMLIIDGKEQKEEQDSMFIDYFSAITFDTSESFYYSAIIDNTFYLIKHKLKK